MSLNALNTMAVEDMDSIPPRKIQLVCEAHRIACRISQEHHAADDDNSGEYGRGSHTYQLSEREIQSYGEQEENNTDIRPYLDIGLVGNSRE